MLIIIIQYRKEATSTSIPDEQIESATAALDEELSDDEGLIPVEHKLYFCIHIDLSEKNVISLHTFITNV